MASIRYDIDPPEVRGRGVQSNLRSGLVHGADPAIGHASQIPSEHDCALARLDSAIVAARSMVALQRLRAGAANRADFQPTSRANAA